MWNQKNVCRCIRGDIHLTKKDIQDLPATNAGDAPVTKLAEQVASSQMTIH